MTSAASPVWTSEPFHIPITVEMAHTRFPRPTDLPHEVLRHGDVLTAEIVPPPPYPHCMPAVPGYAGAEGYPVIDSRVSSACCRIEMQPRGVPSGAAKIAGRSPDDTPTMCNVDDRQSLCAPTEPSS